MFTNIYFRIVTALGVSPSANSPLIVDYIHKESLGIANAYVRLYIFIFN